MSKIELIQASCIEQEVDVIVNAANPSLYEGGGVCGAIFRTAGSTELAEACERYKRPLKDGMAVITPAFNITNAKAIIHAVGPNFTRTPKAFKKLYEAYYNSFVVLMENEYHTIAFPLISAGIFGGYQDDPVGESTKQCIKAYKKFIKKYPDYEVDVKLCAFKPEEMIPAQREFII